MRLAVIYTDIDNIEPIQNSYLWIKDFCNQCNKCVRVCPGEAIFKQNKLLPDNSKICIDYKKCAVPFSNDYGCSVCIKECTFNHGDYKKIEERYICNHSN